MGKAFGRKWMLDISSPSEALKLVNANKPGVYNWIRSNLRQYDSYRVICEYDDGIRTNLDRESYITSRKSPTKIRFVPVITGSGGVAKVIIGIILIVVGLYTENPELVKIGAQLALSGAVELLSPRPKKNVKQETASAENNTSYYFNGPVNTINQGVPVQLLYGLILCGSHAISAEVNIDQLL